MVTVIKINGSKFKIILPSQRKIELELLKGKGTLTSAKYAIEFGKVLKTKGLKIKITKESQYKLTW